MFTELVQTWPCSKGGTLGGFREQAYRAFCKDLLKKEGVYRYLPLSRLNQEAYVPSDVVDAIPHTNSDIVFVNGHFLESTGKQLRKKGVLEPLPKAMLSYEGFLRRAFDAKRLEDTFVRLNAAFHQQGAFLYLPPNTRLDVPIKVTYVMDHTQGYIAPRLHVLLGKQSKACICINRVINSLNYLENSYLDITLEEGAQLTMQTDMRTLPSSWTFDRCHALLKRGAQLSIASITEGSLSVNSSTVVVLDGENSSVDLQGLYHLKGDCESHYSLLVHHRKPSCSSNQYFKGVLEDKSRASFSGKILVDPVAQRTQAYQLNRNLMLSSEAKAYTLPQLEIFADDVRASHGATISELDKSMLFYLRSRGISEALAKTMLVDGFKQDICRSADWNVV